MRDLIAGVIAVLLLVTAASLATTLQMYRKRRQRAQDTEHALGRTIVAEIPTEDDLVLFTEDSKRFYYGDRSIDKDLIAAARVLINGVPIAAIVSRRFGSVASAQLQATVQRGEAAPAEQERGAAAPGVINDHPEGIARDRWDVVIEAVNCTTLVECGAIRERVSQELARAVFEAVKGELERRDSR